MRSVTVVLLLWVSACARPLSTSVNSAPEAPLAKTHSPETIGRALAREGRFMEAAFYFEAAIARGGDEKTVLPFLISAQINAGRLRAAKQNALRLRELTGNNKPLDDLLLLLARYTPEVEDTNGEEALP
jgi:hypothetical protein